MSEQQTAEATATETAATQQTEAEQTKPTETVDFWKAKAREQEKRAKENADAAKRLADIEESQKTEAQKVADRLRELETERDKAQRDALRFKVASKYGIGDEDADLFLTGSDEETLTRQANRLAGREEERIKNNNTAPKEGTVPTVPADKKRDFVRSLTDRD